jgi:branched-chain amino acid transport system permease protein
MQALQLLLNGMAQGCVYALVALGFVLIYKATETVSFVQGELMMVGGFIALISMGPLALPFWLAFVFAVAGTAAMGYGMERFLLRQLLGQPAFTLVLMTLAVGMVLRGLVMMIPGIGTETHVLEAPWREATVAWGGLQLNADRLVVMFVTAVLALLLFVGFRFTRIGIAMQAASMNQIAAHYVGIPVERLNTFVWALSGGVAALAGVLLAPMTFVHVGMGFVGLKALPAAVLGGFASLPGAFVGGLLIGVTEALAGFYLPEGYKDVAPYVLVLLVLMFMPDGLFGGHVRKKV